MDEGMIGEIRMFGGTFAPRSWAFCNGQLLSIAENNALFSILGTTYGGDGRTTFGLPDLRGRVPIQQGTGPGLTNHKLGAKTGTDSNTLVAANLPSHAHGATLTGSISIPVNTDGVDSDSPSGAFPGATGDDFYASSSSPGAFMAALNTDGYTPSVAATGNGQAVNNIMPYLAVNYIIALNGIYPSRN